MEDRMPSQDNINNLLVLPQLDLLQGRQFKKPSSPYTENNNGDSESQSKEESLDIKVANLELILENDLESVCDENDKYIFFLLSSKGIRDIFDKTHDDEQDLSKYFIDECMKIKWCELLQSRFSAKQKGISFSSLEGLFSVEDIYSQEYLGYDIEHYKRRIQYVDDQLNTLVKLMSEYLEILSNGDYDFGAWLGFEMIASFKDILVDNVRFDDRFVNVLKTQLAATSEERNLFYKELPNEIKSRIRFWKDFMEYGYDKGKARRERERRQASL